MDNSKIKKLNITMEFNLNKQKKKNNLEVLSGGTIASV